MRVAVLGSRGMFGKDMLSLLAESGHEAEGFNRDKLNLENLQTSSVAKELENFDCVINAAAYTDVEGAEQNEEMAFRVNGYAPGVLANACKAVGNRFIHISTDYVFDGLTKVGYAIGDRVNPQTVYGKSKALGEKLVAQADADFSIVRTSWLYGSTGTCFPKKIANKLLAGQAVSVVCDQVGQPTWTRDLARQVKDYAALRTVPKMIHVAAGGEISWFGFALEIAKSLGVSSKDLVKAVETPRSANFNRPPYSVLETSESPLAPIASWESRWALASKKVLADFSQ